MNLCRNCAKFDKECSMYRTRNTSACSKFVGIPKTNIEIIRDMSDEELATRNVYKVQRTNDEYVWTEYMTSDGSEFDSFEEAVKYELDWFKLPSSKESGGNKSC